VVAAQAILAAVLVFLVALQTWVKVTIGTVAGLPRMLAGVLSGMGRGLAIGGIVAASALLALSLVAAALPISVGFMGHAPDHNPSGGHGPVATPHQQPEVQQNQQAGGGGGGGGGAPEKPGSNPPCRPECLGRMDEAGKGLPRD
jgi:hypothetical protein